MAQSASKQAERSNASAILAFKIALPSKARKRALVAL
jgi:hypothetical protein